MEDRDLAAHYESLERRFTVRENPDYESLVIPTGNADEPFHRWFHIKEAYSFRLLPRIVKDLGLADQEALRLLDPFSGGGTTVASAADMLSGSTAVREVCAWGVETNPWLHLVSSAKLDSQIAPPACASRHLHAVLSAARDEQVEMERPGLSTFGNSLYLRPDYLRQLLQLRQAIAKIRSCGADCNLNLNQMLSSLVVGCCVEPAMMLRRDGRALRYESGKKARAPFETFMYVASVVAQDLSGRFQNESNLSGLVVRGDSRIADSYPSDADGLDLVMFSPPYPNNIDYTEVYKIESWALGLISDADQFRQQRLATLRSHPSVKFPERYSLADVESEIWNEIVGPLLSVVPKGNRYTHERRRLILGYVDDMHSVMKIAASRLRPGGWLVCVVGNSMHGVGEDRFTIASDLLIADVAERLGLGVERIELARRPTRRSSSSKFLRESIVVCRKASCPA